MSILRQANRMLRRHPRLLEWHLTPWKMNGNGGWAEQPIILIEGQVPFFADHPQSYIDKLEEMSKDPTLFRGAFHTMAGQLKDALEQNWEIKYEKSSSKRV
jgi:hypothetical protein